MSSATATARASAHRQRHADDHEVRRVERRLPERLVAEQLRVVLDPDQSTASGLRMSAERRSVKLITSEASTGPMVKTRNSARNGQREQVARRHLPPAAPVGAPARRWTARGRRRGHGGHVSCRSRCRWPCPRRLGERGLRRRSCRATPARSRRRAVPRPAPRWRSPAPTWRPGAARRTTSAAGRSRARRTPRCSGRRAGCRPARTSFCCCASWVRKSTNFHAVSRFLESLKTAQLLPPVNDVPASSVGIGATAHLSRSPRHPGRAGSPCATGRR